VVEVVVLDDVVETVGDLDLLVRDPQALRDLARALGSTQTRPSRPMRSISESNVPERWPHGKTWYSRKSSSARRRSNSSSETK
jgi:hypothetical protein